jgi:hypothetical protein
LGETHGETVIIKHNLAELYYSEGKVEEAKVMQNEILMLIQNKDRLTVQAATDSDRHDDDDQKNSSVTEHNGMKVKVYHSKSSASSKDKDSS